MVNAETRKLILAGGIFLLVFGAVFFLIPGLTVLCHCPAAPTPCNCTSIYSAVIGIAFAGAGIILVLFGKYSPKTDSKPQAWES